MTKDELITQFIENLKVKQVLSWADLLNAMGSMPQAERDKMLSKASATYPMLLRLWAGL